MIDTPTPVIYDVIIIGAGAAGLIAMRELLKDGYSVCLLEAAPVAGGRIATIREDGFRDPVDTGAEFVHGKLPLTLKLLKKAHIKYKPIAGNMITVQQGKWLENEEHDDHWKEFMRRLDKLKNDMTINGFLDRYFPSPEFDSLRTAVQRFAEGFDLANPDEASILAVRDEWAHEDDKQYRIPDGYGQLISYLEQACHRLKGVLRFNAPVKKINHTRELVTIETTDKGTFQASRVIVTVSVGALKAGTIEFAPALTSHAQAIRQLGFGAVIKILLEFRTPFWRKHAEEIGFLLSDQSIPTWWTQLPEKTNLLTGWLGGPAALTNAGKSKESLLQDALESLSSIFNLPVEKLREQLVHHHITNWHEADLIKGGYSYNTIYSDAAKGVLSQPVSNTVYFGGEALYEGSLPQGTVEAALQNGVEVASRVGESLSKK